MTLVEKIMLIMAVLMPIIALMMFLPKIIKTKIANRPAKEKKKKQKPTEPYVVEPTPVESKPEIVQPSKLSTQSHADDFMDFAERKSKRISAPKRNFPTGNFPEFEGFRPRITPNPTSQDKTIAEEFKSLSPQLKALILSGALERKDYDE